MSHHWQLQLLVVLMMPSMHESKGGKVIPQTCLKPIMKNCEFHGMQKNWSEFFILFCFMAQCIMPPNFFRENLKIPSIDDITDDVIRSKSSSNFEIIITSSIFKLEHRSKVQNARNSMAYFVSTSCISSGLKARPDLNMVSILKISKYFRKVHLDNRYGKIFTNYPRKSSFDVDDVTDDVTV